MKSDMVNRSNMNTACLSEDLEGRTVATFEDNIKTVVTQIGYGDIDRFQMTQSNAQCLPLQS
jgi:hypothetical protein